MYIDYSKYKVLYRFTQIRGVRGPYDGRYEKTVRTQARTAALPNRKGRINGFAYSGSL